MDAAARDPFWWWVLAAGTVFVVLIVLAFYVVPVVTLSEEDVPSPEDLAAQRASLRGNALQAVGAIAIGVGLMLTARSVTLAGRSLAVSREAQLGERVAHALDHLASDKIEVRVGGVYSLERLAAQAPQERGVILQVLTSLVRERTETRPQSGSRSESGVAGPDAEAALDVLNRWPWPLDQPSETSNTDRPL